MIDPAPPSTPEEIADRRLYEDAQAEQLSRPALAGEPAAIIGLIVAVLVAIQQAALPIPAGVNAVISAAIVIAGALGIRSQVTPTHT